MLEKFDLFKKIKNKEVFYLLSLILTLVLMLFAPLVVQIFYFIFMAIKDSGYYTLMLTEGTSEYLKLVNETSFVFQFAGYIILLIVFPLLFFTIFKEDLEKFKKTPLKNVLIVVIGFILMYVLTIIVNQIFEYFNFPLSSQNQDSIENVLKSNLAPIVIITVVVLAPFVEEVIFRKMLFGTCETTFRLKPIVSVILSTLIFSLIHVSEEVTNVFSGASPIYLVAILLYLPLSLILSLSYKLSNNNIFVVILIHLLNNLLSVLLV